VANSGKGEILGHPKGLYVLFFTELWERFSFYSMRGVLVLYMVAVVLAARADAGGHADQIYGAYLGFVYSATFIGGMLADRLLGQRRAIYIGGTLMALAQFTLAAHALLMKYGLPVEKLHAMFFLGLGLLSAGNGFFKPNISTIVGTLYTQGDARRDAAFTIFYMGINIGAFLAGFSGQIGEMFGWYLAFLLAGIGMILGLVIFSFGRGQLPGKGLPPPGATLIGRGRFGVPNVLVLVLGVGLFIPLAAYLISQPQWVQSLALWIAVPILAYLIWEAVRAGKEEGSRMVVILVLCCFSMMFWGFFELAGSTITRFTNERVDRILFGFELKASFLSQVINPALIIALSIPFSVLWVWLDRRRLEPSSPLKFALGLAQLGLGFLMLYIGAQQAGEGGKCSLLFLFLAYLFHTTGELCLSPVGLSTVTKLAPVRLVGMFMGVWFLSSALGNVFAGRVGGLTSKHGFGTVFVGIAITTGLAALLLFILVPVLKKLMRGVK
jgi:POT family proton-dependent oligopeptide transporter